jgi:hypothetical protein
VAARAVAKRLAAARKAFLDVVDFVVQQGKASPNAVFAGSVPYLMLAGNLVAGWQLARSLLVAEDLLQKGEDAAFMRAKIATARFYADHILAKAPGCATASSKARTASPRWRSSFLIANRKAFMSKLPAVLQNLPLPVIASPMFIVSTRAGDRAVQGGDRRFHAGAERAAGVAAGRVAARDQETLAAYNRAIPASPAAPFAINQIVHKSNDRLEHDMEWWCGTRCRSSSPRWARAPTSTTRSTATAAWCCTTSSTTCSPARRSRRAPTA